MKIHQSLLRPFSLSEKPSSCILNRKQMIYFLVCQMTLSHLGMTLSAECENPSLVETVSTEIPCPLPAVSLREAVEHLYSSGELDGVV